MYATHGDAAGIVGVVQRGDEHLWRALQLFGRGDHFDDAVQQVVDRFCGSAPILAHPVVFRRTIYDGEVQLFFGRVEVAHQVEYHLVHFLGTAVGLVHLVDHHDGFESDLQRLLQHESGLWHRSLEGVNQQDTTVCHIEYAFYLATKVGVPRSINDIDLGALVIDRHVLRQDGDAALALQVVVVQDQFTGILVLSKQIACQQHFVDKRSLTVVYVSNDGDVANILHRNK